MPDQVVQRLFIEYDKRKEGMENEEGKFYSSFEKGSRSSFKNPLGSDADADSDDLDDRMNVDIEVETDSCGEDFAEGS